MNAILGNMEGVLIQGRKASSLLNSSIQAQVLRRYLLL